MTVLVSYCWFTPREHFQLDDGKNEQVKFQLDGDDVRFVLVQHTLL